MLLCTPSAIIPESLSLIFYFPVPCPRLLLTPFPHCSVDLTIKIYIFIFCTFRLPISERTHLLGLCLSSWVKTMVIICSGIRFLAITHSTAPLYIVELNIHETRECKEWDPEGIHLGRSLFQLLTFFFFLFFLCFNKYSPAKLNSSVRCVWENQSQEYFLAKMRNPTAKVCHITAYIGSGQLFLLFYPCSLLRCNCTCHKAKTHVTVKETIHSSWVLREQITGQKILILTFGFQGILIA